MKQNIDENVFVIFNLIHIILETDTNLCFIMKISRKRIELFSLKPTRQTLIMEKLYLVTSEKQLILTYNVYTVP